MLKFNQDKIDKLNKRYSVEKVKAIGRFKNDSSTYAVKFKSNQNIDKLIKEYMATGLFEYVEPNFIASVGGFLGAALNLPIIPNDNCL